MFMRQQFLDQLKNAGVFLDTSYLFCLYQYSRYEDDIPRSTKDWINFWIDFCHKYEAKMSLSSSGIADSNGV